MDLDYKEIGKRIRDIRMFRKLSQAALAEKADVSPQYICLVEAGKKQLSLTVLVRIASALSVSSDHLLFGRSAGSHSGKDELTLLLSDCSESESNVIMDVAEAAKKSLAKNRGRLFRIV